MTTYIIGGIVLLVAIFLVTTYNRLVVLRQRVRNAWAQVDVQLRRRYDLIPNLVNTVKGYASHERETLESITQARAGAIAAGSVEEQAEAETMLTGALRTLFAVAESYPELKADANFRHLQQELSDTESRIAYARQFYNDTVQKLNTRMEMFPTNLVARMMGFEQEDYFNVDGEARDAVRVEFD